VISSTARDEELTERSLLQNLPFQKVQHRIDTTDAQPFNEQGGILVLVTGALQVGGTDVLGFFIITSLTGWDNAG
jgi:hypothetical protein